MTPEQQAQMQEAMRAYVRGGPVPEGTREVMEDLKEAAREKLGMSKEDSDFVTLVHRWWMQFEHDGIELNELFGMDEVGMTMFIKVVEDIGKEEPTIARSKDIQAIWTMAFSLGMLAQRYVDAQEVDGA